MKYILASLLLVISTSASAEIVTLECKGTKSDGKEITHIVRYDEEANWVDDNGVMPLTGAVHSETLSGIRLLIDRRTGAFKSRPNFDYGTGTCAKLVRKF